MSCPVTFGRSPRSAVDANYASNIATCVVGILDLEIAITMNDQGARCMHDIWGNVSPVLLGICAQMSRRQKKTASNYPRWIEDNISNDAKCISFANNKYVIFNLKSFTWIPAWFVPLQMSHFSAYTPNGWGALRAAFRRFVPNWDSEEGENKTDHILYTINDKIDFVINAKHVRAPARTNVGMFNMLWISGAFTIIAYEHVIHVTRFLVLTLIVELLAYELDLKIPS